MSANFSAEGAARIPCAQLSTGNAQDVPFSLHGFPAPFRRRFPVLLLCLANFCGALFACLQKLEHCASTSSLLRLLAQSSVLPLRGHLRVSHADGHAVVKVRC